MSKLTDRTPLRALAVALLAAAVWFAVPSPAAAHGGPGVIEVGDPVEVGALEVEFPIRLTFANDGHAAEPDEVEGMSVSGTGPDGQTYGPVDPFTPGDAPGVYIARIQLPSEGTWELTIEVAEPASSADITVDAFDVVVAPEGEAEADPPIGGAPPADPDAVDVDDDFMDDGLADDQAATDLAGEDAGTIPIVLVVIGFILASVAGVFAFRLYRNQMTAPE